VYFSTEHVFGDSAAGHAEDDLPAPRSVYAQSKVAAENLVRDLLPDAHLILRTSWVFGPEAQRKNFVYRAVATLRRREYLVVPQDQYGQPTYAPDLAQVAHVLCQRGLRGTFHVVGPEKVNRLQFARRIARIFGLEVRLIQGVATAQLGQAAPRPLQPTLQREKLCRTFGGDPVRGMEPALIELRDGPEQFRP
jgi:dTDP-4-dehydrorhamnose reductase